MTINEKGKNMLEKWIKWKPISCLNNKYYIESIKHDKNGFIIILEHCNEYNQKKQIKIIFDGPIESYRYCDEHCRIELLEKLNGKYGAQFYLDWRYFIVENSEYLKWLEQESCTIVSCLEVKHYVFIDNDCILDVVVSFNPKIEVIKTN